MSREITDTSKNIDIERARMDLGFTKGLHKAFRRLDRPDCVPGRVIADYGTRFSVDPGNGPLIAVARGALLHDDPTGRPVVGDWVALGPSVGGVAPIEAVVPRERAIVRKAAGERTLPQVVAAWIDTAFIVCGLDGDFNPRRVERILTALGGSGAQPVVLLNKADLCTDREGTRAALAVNAPVCFVSAVTGEGIDIVATMLGRGRTGVLVGTSGVGKSTLTNRLLGREAQATGGVRDGDDRGRHTTTSRSMWRLPDDGGLLVDTPGMRELGLWAGEADVAEEFADVQALSDDCRFRDCGHGDEPGCAVRAAVESGALDPARLRSYDKLGRELAYAERRQDEQAARSERSRWKSITTRMRARRNFENQTGGKGW